MIDDTTETDSQYQGALQSVSSQLWHCVNLHTQQNHATMKSDDRTENTFSLTHRR